MELIKLNPLKINQTVEFENARYRAGHDDQGNYFFQTKPNGVIKNSKNPFEIVEMINKADKK
jgi:hypothetical protein